MRRERRWASPHESDVDRVTDRGRSGEAANPTHARELDAGRARSSTDKLSKLIAKLDTWLSNVLFISPESSSRCPL